MRPDHPIGKLALSLAWAVGLFVLTSAVLAAPVVLPRSSEPDLGAGFGLAVALFVGAFVGIVGGLLTATNLFLGMTFREMFLGGEKQ